MYLYISLFSKQNTLITLHCIYLFYSLSKCLYIVLYIYIFILQVNIIIFFLSLYIYCFTFSCIHRKKQLRK